MIALMKPLRALTTVVFTFLTFSTLRAADDPSLVGTWKGSPEGDSDTVVTLEFKEDGTGNMGMGGRSFEIEYSIDRSVTPHTLDFSGTPPGAPEPQDMLTIFEFVDADTLKVAEPEKERPSSYDEGDTLIAKRVSGEEASEESAETPVELSEIGKKLVGKWVGSEGGDGDTIMLEFREDGTGTLKEGNSPDAFKFTVSGEEAPYKLSLMMDGDETAVTKFEFEGEKVRIDEPGSGSDTEFSEDAILFEAMKAMEGEPAEVLIGTWAMAGKPDAVKIQFNEDGTGTLWDGGQEMEMQYELASDQSPIQLSITIEGETQHSLMEFISEEKVMITEPEGEVAESLDEAAMFERQP